MQFGATYGWELFDSGNIPWGWFWFLHNRKEQTLAFYRVNQTEAVSVAMGMAWGNKHAPKVAQHDRKLAAGT